MRARPVSQLRSQSSLRANGARRARRGALSQSRGRPQTGALALRVYTMRLEAEPLQPSPILLRGRTHATARRTGSSLDERLALLDILQSFLLATTAPCQIRAVSQ